MQTFRKNGIRLIDKKNADYQEKMPILSKKTDNQEKYQFSGNWNKRLDIRKKMQINADSSEKCNFNRKNANFLGSLYLASLSHKFKC